MTSYIQNLQHAPWDRQSASGMLTKAVIYIATGGLNYIELTKKSIASLRARAYRGTIIVVTDQPASFELLKKDTRLTIELAELPIPGKYASRFAKTSLNQYAAADINLYLDADTLVLRPIDEIWSYVSNADLALALEPSLDPVKDQAIRHSSAFSVEEAALVSGLEFKDPRYFNSGVLLWKKGEASDAFFKAWHEEWLRFQKVDQPSLVRALRAVDIQVQTLPPKFNHTPKTTDTEPIVIEHYWESIRETGEVQPISPSGSKML